MPQTLTEITHSMTPRVDREAGVIHGVKVLGKESKNGRTYSQRALKEAAKLYDRRDVNLNHPPRDKAGSERPVEAMFGWLESVEVRDDGVYADLHYATSHPMAPAIVEIAQKNPMRLGLSHNAEGTVVKRDGKAVVESIESVRSVDLVQTPATVSGLFEATDARRHPSKTCRQILEDYTGSALPPVPGMEDDSEPPMETEPGEPAEDPQREAKAALTQVFSAALMAGGDLKSILSQVVALATAMMSKMPDEETPAEDSEEQPADEMPEDETSDDSAAMADETDNGQPPEDPTQKRKPPMAESKETKVDPTKELLESLNAAVEELKAERRERQMRDMLESANVEPTQPRVDALLRLFKAEDQQALIESFPQRERIARGPRPAVRTVLQESAAQKYPDHNPFLRRTA